MIYRLPNNFFNLEAIHFTPGLRQLLFQKKCDKITVLILSNNLIYYWPTSIGIGLFFNFSEYLLETFDINNFIKHIKENTDEKYEIYKFPENNIGWKLIIHFDTALTCIHKSGIGFTISSKGIKIYQFQFDNCELLQAWDPPKQE